MARQALLEANDLCARDERSVARRVPRQTFRLFSLASRGDQRITPVNNAVSPAVLGLI